jgi:ankyrin repeat protein
LGQAVGRGQLTDFNDLFTAKKAKVTDTYKNKPILNYAIESYIYGLVATDHFKGVDKPIKKMIKFLLKNGAPIDLTDESGITALHEAVSVRENMLEKLGKLEELKNLINLLLQNGADINAQDDKGNTPLHRAITFASPNIIALLLKNGAKTDIQNNQGLTARALVIKHAQDEEQKSSIRQQKRKYEDANEIKDIFDKHFKPLNLSKVRETEKKNPKKSTQDVGFKFE